MVSNIVILLIRLPNLHNENLFFTNSNDYRIASIRIEYQHRTLLFDFDVWLCVAFPKCDVRGTLSAYGKTFLSCTPTIPRDRNKFYCRLVLISNHVVSVSAGEWKSKNHAFSLSLSRNVKIGEKAILYLSLFSENDSLPESKNLLFFLTFLYSSNECEFTEIVLAFERRNRRERERERRREDERARACVWECRKRELVSEKKRTETGKGGAERLGRDLKNTRGIRRRCVRWRERPDARFFQRRSHGRMDVGIMEASTVPSVRDKNCR